MIATYFDRFNLEADVGCALQEVRMSAETLEFKTDLKQLLDIITHSLYSHKEVFLRELISNASDAIDKVRFNSLSNEAMLEGDAEWKIKLHADKEAGTLTVSDNGIGMSRSSIVEDLGTIARSGTQAFLDRLSETEAKQRPELIGQFGVGFYASFMVADRVTVISRAAGDGEGVRWESDGKGEFSVEEAQKSGRGTDVILHLRDDAKEFLEEWRIRQIVTKFSDFLEHPVVMDVEKNSEAAEGKEAHTETIEEKLNTQKAIWLRSKSEISDAEYQEFYKHLSRDMQEPAKTIHYKVEGATEFNALLFIPKHKPADLLWSEPKSPLQLYIKRVFITNDCQALMPTYLRFVHGVVDCADLPLNVSREMLQHNPTLATIRKNLVKKVLTTLDGIKNDNREEYVAFFKELGTILKEGINQDWANREQIADLLLFESTATDPGEYRSLSEYVEQMGDDQSDIYYLTGESRSSLSRSPYLEAFRQRGHEVLLMTEPFDEFMITGLLEYKGKELKAADKGELPVTEKEKESHEQAKQEYSGLLDYLNRNLDDVKEVRLSNRLTESASCLVVDEGAMGAHMEQLMERIGRGDSVTPAKRILELNGNHAVIKALHQLFEEAADDPRISVHAKLLYEQAVIAEGSKVKDPGQLAELINDLMIQDAKR